MKELQKVFGIGFHKTATTSLQLALEHLGYRVTAFQGRNDPDRIRNVLHLCCDLAEQFDGFQDLPWPVLYREMDERFPGSKFILTTRPTESWVRSVVEHFGERDTAMRKWVYGVGHPVGHEDVYVERYERHNREVLEYFAHRPDDMLELKITEGDGWPELSPFLGLPIPDVDFPQANTAKMRVRRSRPMNRFSRKLKRELYSGKRALGARRTNAAHRISSGWPRT